MVGKGEKTGKMSERERKREKERQEKAVQMRRIPKEMLLIILTPGVRLNERKSQTREAWCKFNYREEKRAERRRARRKKSMR